MDAALSLILFEDRQGHLGKGGEISGSIFNLPTAIFAKSDIQLPMKIVLDVPVLTEGTGDSLRIRDI